MLTNATAENEPETVFHSRISSDFYAYWQRLAQRRGGIPFRSDIEPADVPRLLPYIFIVERIKATGRYFFRLSGTGIRDIMGFENTNRFLDELLHGEDLKTVSEMFEQVMNHGACIRSIEGLTYSDQTHRRVEILRLPLRAADGECRLLFGCLSRTGDETGPGAIKGTIKDKQVIHIQNDVEPRSSFPQSLGEGGHGKGAAAARAAAPARPGSRRDRKSTQPAGLTQ